MNQVKEPFGVRKFEQVGFLATNDAELFANTIMQLHEREVSFKPSGAGGFKYCIVKTDRQ
ncbi:hypothetical protein D3C74_403140 [compost metagenome]